MKKFFEEELIKVENGKWKCSHIICMLNHWMRDLLFHSFHYLVSWLLFFEKLYSLIWASCPSNKKYMKEKTTEIKETI